MLRFPCVQRTFQAVTISFSTRLYLEDVLRDVFDILSWKDTQRSWRALYILIVLAVTATFLNTSITLYILFVAVFVTVNWQ